VSSHDSALHTLPPFEEIREQYLPLLSREAADADPGRTSGVDWSEKVQIGLIALWEAYQHWSPEGRANFTTYATHAIRHALHQRVRTEKGMGLTQLPARLPRSKIVKRWEALLGRELTPEETETALRIAQYNRRRLLEQSDPGTIRSGDELRPGPHEHSQLSALVERRQDAQLLQALETVLHGRDQDIVGYWLAGATHKAIGGLVGVSGARISQILPGLVAKVMEAAPRMTAMPFTPELVEPPVDRSLRPPIRPPEPPRFVRRDGDLLAHKLECPRDAGAIVATKNRPGATLPWNVSCSPALGGCGAGGDVLDPHGPSQKVSSETVLPKTGLTPGLALAPAVRAVAGPMERLWREQE